MQHEITQRKPLLDDNNNIIEPGYAKKLLPIYNKKTDFKSRFHTKEWDNYLICNQDYALALTLADNGYMGLDSISLLDFNNGWEITNSPMQFFTMGKKNLPETSESGNIEYGDKNYHISFINEITSRHLFGWMNNFFGDQRIDFDITLCNIPEESMVIATPFDKPGYFYYNQKINCMVAEGTVKCAKLTVEFKKENSAAVLDWGRGIWTYSNTWYWSSLNTYIDGKPFGFNLGYGFGNTSAASENMLFYQGKAHKLDQVTFNIPKTKRGKDDFLEEWTVTSNDNRVNLRFEPVLDRKSNTNVIIIQSDQHQVFGKFYGDCVLDDGSIIKLDGQLGFAEKFKNRW